MLDLSKVSTLELQVEILKRDILIKENELNRLKLTLQRLEAGLPKDKNETTSNN